MTTWLVADGVPLNDGTVKVIMGKVRLNPVEPEENNTKKPRLRR